MSQDTNSSGTPPQTWSAQQQAIQNQQRAAEQAATAKVNAAFEAARQAGITGGVVFGNASGPKVFRPGKTGKGKGK